LQTDWFVLDRFRRRIFSFARSSFMVFPPTLRLENQLCLLKGLFSFLFASSIFEYCFFMT
jgi:hypothetical protein